MSDPSKVLNSELQEIIKEQISIEKSIKRYGIMFPDKISTFEVKYHCEPYEVMIGLYIADYIITSAEYPMLTDDERLDIIYKTLKMGMEDANITFIQNLELLQIVIDLNSKIRKKLQYQGDRGFPLELILSQINETIIFEYFDKFIEIFSEVDYKWILSQIESNYTKKSVIDIYPYVSNLYEFTKLSVNNYYIIGKILIERLNLEIKNKELISNSAYLTQISGNSVILSYYTDGVIFTGKSNTPDNYDLNSPNVVDSLISVINSNPKIQGVSGVEELIFHSTTTKQNIGKNKKIFVVLESDETSKLLFIIESSSITEINLAHVRKILHTYLINIQTIKDLPKNIIKEILDNWAQHLLVSQTVLDSELDEVPVDNERELNWTVESIIKSQSDEKFDIFSRLSTHGLLQATLHEYITYIGILHTLIKNLESNPALKLSIVPYEALFEKKTVSSKYYLFHENKNKNIMIILKTKEISSNKYIPQKSDGINRKFTRMKMNGLLKNRDVNYDDWLENRLGFMTAGKFDLEYAILTLSDPLADEFGDKPVIIESKGISVSDRLKSLEINKDAEFKVKNYLFDFMIETIKANLILSLVRDPKMSVFIDVKIKNSKEKEAKQIVDTMIDKYNIYKLSGLVGKKVLDITNTIDNLLIPALRESMFKLGDLDRTISKMHNTQISEILKMMESSEE